MGKQGFEEKFDYHIRPSPRSPVSVPAPISSNTSVVTSSPTDTYYLTFTGDRQFRKLTPYGEILLIAAWLSLAL